MQADGTVGDNGSEEGDFEVVCPWRLGNIDGGDSHPCQNTDCIPERKSTLHNPHSVPNCGFIQ